MTSSPVSLLLVLASPLVTSLPSPGCGRPVEAGPDPGQYQKFQVDVGDEWVGELTRDYYLHLGAAYDPANTAPAPLVLDFPGWCVTAQWQMENKPWPVLADSEPAPGLIYVTMEGMNDVENATYTWNSWNHSSTMGPQGLTCDPELVMDHWRPCYTSCAQLWHGGDCDYPYGSCDWVSCHDDVTYTEIVLYDILDRFCVDTEQIHVTGMSNGGMFIWSRIMDRLAETVASAGTVCSSPTRGFNVMPSSPVSIIDFHGFLDNVVPYSPEAPDNLGEGPDMTTEAKDGHYYHQKLDLLTSVAGAMHCAPAAPWPTHMDGQAGWGCQVWAECDGGNEVVGCVAQYGHSYPWHGETEEENKLEIEGFKITWDFMKTHKNRVNK